MTDDGRFRREVLPHLEHLHSVARSMIQDRANTGDLVLQTLMKARDQYLREKPEDDVRSWLTRIMNELWLDRFRSGSVHDGRRTPEGRTDRSGAGIREAPDDEHWIEGVEFEDVREALMRISAPYRRLLVLSMSDQLDVHAVAEQQDIAPKRVRWQFERAKQLLKEELTNRDSGWDGNLRFSDTE